MQKDFHFYLTYALARKAGISDANAKTIAWADEYTDELTQADLHGIQTQCADLGNWADSEIQLTVLCAFHFLPGDNDQHPWMTTRNSPRAQALVRSALESGDLFRLGTALHSFQDTFSHETFSGWREDLNSCYPWYYLKSGLPNVGHAELLAAPDVINYVWTDPRTGAVVDNKERAMSAAQETYFWLGKLQHPDHPPSDWDALSKELFPMFQLESYDDRITQICKWSGNSKLDYKPVNSKCQAKPTRASFVAAASQHLVDAVGSFKGLPWL